MASTADSAEQTTSSESLILPPPTRGKGGKHLGINYKQCHETIIRQCRIFSTNKIFQIGRTVLDLLVQRYNEWCESQESNLQLEEAPLALL